jgi:thymidylate kinase
MTTKELTVKETSTVLSAFFEYLERMGLEHCVLGRTDELPDKIPGDVDIVINADPFDVLYRHIYDFSGMNSLKTVQILNHEPFAYYFVLTWKDRLGTPMFLHLDICYNNFWNGRLFLTADEILSSSTPAIDESGEKKNFFVAAPAKGFIYYLIKKVDKQNLNDGQGKYLNEVWAKASEESNKEIDRFWSNDNAKLLRQAAGDGDWRKVRKILPTLKKSLYSEFPANFLGSWAKETIRKIERVLLPTGLHVAFLGPDGSGKSSIIDRVTPDLAPAFRKTAYFHLRPGLGIKKTDGKPVVDPHGQVPRNQAASVAKIFYLWLDYFVGWWLAVWPKKVHSTLVVFDRYYHDLLVDPTRYRYGAPMWLARWIGKLIPKPDIWILLDAPPEVLQSRKQEVPFEETARQRKEYLKLVRGMKNGVVIDASQDLNDVVAEVNEVIIDFMAKRTEKRHG